MQDQTLPIIAHFFPNYRLVDIDAGHWVISENPEAFKNGSFFLIIPPPFSEILPGKLMAFLLVLSCYGVPSVI